MDERDYSLVKRRVLELTRVDLNNYKSQQVQRRLSTLLARSGHSTWQAYLAHLQHDREALQSFRDYLTINVTEFFRDASKWEYLERTVLPELLRHRRRLRIWSAGCSHGAEPYSLAILLDELTGAAGRHYLLATDLDQGMLATAQQGGPFPANEVKAMSAGRLEHYMRADGDRFFVRPEIVNRVTFRAHDLLRDPFESDMDLIVCRNVVIYFVEETKRALYRRFAQALRPGGVLFVGGTEIVPSNAAMPLGNMAISFYRKRE